MQLFEKCNNIFSEMYRTLSQEQCQNLIQKTESGKHDTLFMDLYPEEMIVSGLMEYSEKNSISIACITEEMGFVAAEIRPLCDYDYITISDPLDGSSQLEEILQDENGTLEELLKPKKLVTPRSSITVLSKGKILFSLVLNLSTGEITSCTSDGLYIDDRKVEFRENYSNPKRIIFYNRNRERQQNAVFTGLDEFEFVPGYPAGANRWLYLTTEMPENYGLVAFNGESHTEFWDSLAAAFFCKELQAYKLIPEQPVFMRGYPLAPELNDSVLKPEIDYNAFLYEPDKRPVNPAECKDTVVIVPTANRVAYDILEQRTQQKRAVKLFI